MMQIINLTSFQLRTDRRPNVMRHADEASMIVMSLVSQRFLSVF